ncbi:TPA: hypothetical protein M2Q89_004765 [Escherichia coli]|nr:hypothetical protein [Escherichia coli]
MARISSSVSSSESPGNRPHPHYCLISLALTLSPEEQAALDKSMEKERAEMEKVPGPIPTSFN